MRRSLVRVSTGMVGLDCSLVVADWEENEGYVQGMSDLCAPVYVVMGSDEDATFWCFVEVMNRMVHFIRLSLLDSE